MRSIVKRINKLIIFLKFMDGRRRFRIYRLQFRFLQRIGSLFRRKRDILFGRNIKLFYIYIFKREGILRIVRGTITRSVFIIKIA